MSLDLLTLMCLLVFLVFTLPVPATVVYLGEPDLLRIVAGYAGMALLLGLFFSIALFAGALVNDRIGALVVGLEGEHLVQGLAGECLLALLDVDQAEGVVRFDVGGVDGGAAGEIGLGVAVAL